MGSGDEVLNTKIWTGVASRKAETIIGFPWLSYKVFAIIAEGSSANDAGEPIVKLAINMVIHRECGARGRSLCRSKVWDGR